MAVSKQHDKCSEDLEFFNRRLNEIGLSDIERLKAKAQFARAEAVADICAAIAHGFGRLFKAPAGKPPHRPATSAS